MACVGIYDLIIVGGGPGGMTAGIYAMRAALKTVLVEMGAPGGQVNLSDAVENWPGNEHIGGAELSLKMSQHAQSYGWKSGPTKWSRWSRAWISTRSVSRAELACRGMP